MRASLFKISKPKQFKYAPRYWDERKEELDRVRMRYADPEKASSAENVKHRISGRWKRTVDHKTRQRSSVLTVLVYLLLIALLIWYVLF